MIGRLLIVLGLCCLVEGIVLLGRRDRFLPQRGTIRLRAGALSQTATITAVDVSRTIFTATAEEPARVMLVNSTTIEVSLPQPLNHDLDVWWRLREYPPANARTR